MKAKIRKNVHTIHYIAKSFFVNRFFPFSEEEGLFYGKKKKFTENS